jgi:hypothetical protein
LQLIIIIIIVIIIYLFILHMPMERMDEWMNDSLIFYHRGTREFKPIIAMVFMVGF